MHELIYFNMYIRPSTQTINDRYIIEVLRLKKCVCNLA